MEKSKNKYALSILIYAYIHQPTMYSPISIAYTFISHSSPLFFMVDFPHSLISSINQ